MEVCYSYPSLLCTTAREGDLRRLRALPTVKVGPQSYETVFQVYIFDKNKHLVALVFSNSVGSESAETWGTVFRALGMVLSCGVRGRTTVVNQDK